ncbi:MAG: hypothetical protein SOR95_08425 [Sutterella sp.]|nr:hypothetical protein [Sutterella sp.]
MREAQTFTIKDFDKELKVKVTPMPATKAESFIYRLLLALDFKGVANDVQNVTPEAIVTMVNGLDYETAKPLLDELLRCCVLVTEGGVELALTPEKVDATISDPTTLMTLRLKSAKVNFGFFLTGGYQNFLSNLRGSPNAD